MTGIKFITLSSFMLFFVACGGEKKALLFEIQTDEGVFHQNQSIAVSIKNDDQKEITTVVYSIDGKELPLSDGKIVLDVQKLGNKTLTAKIGYNDTIR